MIDSSYKFSDITSPVLEKDAAFAMGFVFLELSLINRSIGQSQNPLPLSHVIKKISDVVFTIEKSPLTFSLTKTISEISRIVFSIWKGQDSQTIGFS